MSFCICRHSCLLLSPLLYGNFSAICISECFTVSHTLSCSLTSPNRAGASVGTKATSARAAKAASNNHKSKAAAKPKKAAARGSRRSARRRIDDDDDDDDEDDDEEEAEEAEADADGDDDMGTSSSSSSSSSSSAVGGPAFWLSFAACAATHSLLSAARRLLLSVSLARHPEALPTLVETMAACARVPSDMCDAGLEQESGSSSSSASASFSSSLSSSSSSSSLSTLADFSSTAACVCAIREAAFDALALCVQPLQDDSSSASSSSSFSSSATNGAGAQVPLVLRALLPIAMGHLGASHSGGLRGNSNGGKLLPPKVAEALRTRTLQFIAHTTNGLLEVTLGGSSASSSSSSSRRRSSFGLAFPSVSGPSLVGADGSLAPLLLSWLYVFCQHLLARSNEDAAAARAVAVDSGMGCRGLLGAVGVGGTGLVGLSVSGLGEGEG
jgi:hypothetical protein